MYGFDFKQAGRVAAIGVVLLLGACGGGDSGPTGPGGGGSLAGTYQLVGINNTDLPAVAQMEHCTPTNFTAGSIILGADGTWQIGIQTEDETGQHVIRDYGRFQRNGTQLGFSSAQFGDSFVGELEDDLVVLYYDFCANGEADIDFVFE